MALNQDNVFKWGNMSSELALKYPAKRVGLDQSEPHHHLVEN